MKERIVIFLQEAGEKNMPARKNRDAEKIKERFFAAMDDDFNTPEALAAIFELMNLGNIYLSKKDTRSAAGVKGVLLRLAAILGISAEEPEFELEARDKLLIKERSEARRKKDFKRADEIRKELLKRGMVLEDTATGTKCRRKI